MATPSSAVAAQAGDQPHPIRALLDRLHKEAAPTQGGLFDNQPAPVMVAYGAGVDSTAMLIEMVEAGIRVDIVLFADTGAERPETYAYLELFKAWLAARGVLLIVVRYEPKNFKNFPPYRTLDENCFTNGTLPSITFGFSSCSQKWKVQPQNKWTQAWEPAVTAWASGGKVIKLIGYDCSPADAKRYAHAEGYLDSRYAYGYPLREMGWKREDCIARILAAGLPAPKKSACYFCVSTKPAELHDYSKAQLRRIVLLEARAAPRLRNVDGLWRKPIKGARGATPRPGRMTDYIRSKSLLPPDEIDEIIAAAPAALARWQHNQEHLDPADRPDLVRWLNLFDMRDRQAFTPPGGEALFATTTSISQPTLPVDPVRARTAQPHKVEPHAALV